MLLDRGSCWLGEGVADTLTTSWVTQKRRHCKEKDVSGMRICCKRGFGSSKKGESSQESVESWIWGEEKAGQSSKMSDAMPQLPFAYVTPSSRRSLINLSTSEGLLTRIHSGEFRKRIATFCKQLLLILHTHLNSRQILLSGKIKIQAVSCSVSVRMTAAVRKKLRPRLLHLRFELYYCHVSSG